MWESGWWTISNETLRRDFNLNDDVEFAKYLKEIDQCDIPMPNVARDLLTGNTHSFDKVSTRVRMLWLVVRFSDSFLYPTQWLGENCYQSMFDIGKVKDIWVYEDSDIFVQDGIEDCKGEFMDVKTKEIITVDNDNGFSYTCRMNY